MFIITVVSDTIVLPPDEFEPGKHITHLRRRIQEKYVDRVIPEVGLVIALYDVIRITDAYIHPADFHNQKGGAFCKVAFRLCVFRPMVGETLVGVVDRSTATGLYVKLGSWFKDVHIPYADLKDPCLYDEQTKLWIWQYKRDDATDSFFYRPGATICFTVKGIVFNQRQEPKANSALAEAVAEKEAKGPTAPLPPMQVLGSVAGDGMGLTSWWLDE
ncbi:DNA-directed RNA polymerase III subunit RPC8 [Perkinsus chesapeaki]|uniref:DNA-directed RNA polymerase III subunit RPC8 n=1 Tax=Perkinsus chesapeaki TaxID=330153 RepID=A0A7J6MXD4_PERCH|nr:DNA-directed RNA polymerase III subunit RPC8 [Perkinsus chesapeaki]